MSDLPDMGLPNTMSEVEYDTLPAGVARRIEVVHGYVIACESPTPQHQQVARPLANTFEAARPKEPRTRVQMETDVALWHVPKYTFRRPDVVVYRCKEDRNAKPEASDVLLMVEVSSPSTEREDFVDKMAQFHDGGRRQRMRRETLLSARGHLAVSAGSEAPSGRAARCDRLDRCGRVQAEAVNEPWRRSG